MLDNKHIAEKRLSQVTRRLTKSQGLMARYDAAIREYLVSGVAEKVTQEMDQAQNAAHIYYMPHHAVIREDRITTKMRIVFDASSHEAGTSSLNDNLNAGPNLNPDIMPLLMNFRLYPVALVSDVQKAFLQIAIHEDDRDALRLLWYSTTPVDGQLVPNVETWRMTRVTFGTAPSTFLLAATLQHHIQRHASEHPRLARILENSIYVDDVIFGAANEEEAEEMYTETLQLFGKASMKLQKWGSNSYAMREKFKSEPDAVLIGNTTKVLGIPWNQEQDTLSLPLDFHRTSGEYNGMTTKRQVLRSVAQIYDPLGFILPYTVTGKMLLQEIWKHGLEWDAPLPDDIARKWGAWHNELQDLKDIEIPRCYLPDMSTEIQPQLHFFSDASPGAYGTVVYLRLGGCADGYKTQLIAARSRIAPVKEVTLARMELLGALMSARLASYLRDNFKLTTSDFFWTDSMIALQWIRGDANRWPQFVRNRVTEIQQKVEKDRWRYVGTEANPADLLTRGTSPKKLLQSKLWWKGPSWLAQSDDKWPSPEVNEMTRTHVHKEQVVLQTIAPSCSDPVMDLGRFSNVNNLHRVTAWIIRFTKNSRGIGRINGPLSASEIQQAERYWVRQEQESAFADEISALGSNNALKRTSKLKDLRPFIDDDGILRLGGRMGGSRQTFSECHPIILPTHSHYARLLILQSHRQVFHCGVRDTLVQLRERFWILRARQQVKRILRGCVTCRRNDARHLTQPDGQLPPDRVTMSHPFEVTGIDFAGPVMLKRRRNYHKGYIVLFTCAVTRAVHLELCEDMSAIKFLQAFRRFTARRGICQTIYSDNALTFKKVAREIRDIQRILTDPLVQDYSSRNGIRWKFIPERAPWWGGFYERLIRSVKSALRKTLSRNVVDFIEMQTLLAEVEAMMNSRPITFVYNENSEPTPLTPATMIMGRRLLAPPSTESTTSRNTIHDASSTKIRETWKRQLHYLNAVWNRWQQEYLSELRSAYHSKGTNDCDVRTGDLVLVKEPNCPRLQWKMALVEKVFTGSDGRVRVCLIRTPGRTILRRPVQHLYKLESQEK
ncbi:uncharacterized protein LOC135388341 [Ornithodoros turicata]|uniref:uncharacterized protein LOC135388341 n=1 Tax=Ornithodoros turicata TaxID=34597 RepID=UPI0031393258